VNARPQWGYVQARLQARHGERLQEGEWHALEAARSIEHYLERARGSPLRRLTDRVNGRMSAHAIERALRAAWRAYVAEVAGWVPREWQPAVLWTAHLADLPGLDALLRGETPGWTQHEPALFHAADRDPQFRVAHLENSPLAPLVAAAATERSLTARWHNHWRALWPGRAAETRRLTAFADVIQRHVERLAMAGSQESSVPHRQELASHLARMFRRNSASPVAVFCHLALVALDLERLRGGLSRRRLFETGHRREAA
jgi:hypothetical protein